MVAILCRTFLQHRKSFLFPSFCIFSLNFASYFFQCSMFTVHSLSCIWSIFNSVHFNSIEEFNEKKKKNFYDSSLGCSEMQFDRKYLYFIRFPNCWTKKDQNLLLKYKSFQITIYAIEFFQMRIEMEWRCDLFWS